MVTTKNWQEMTKGERKAEQTRQLEAAILRIEGDGFPASVKVKIGDHTLKTRPVRETDSGGVSYNLGGVFLQIGKYKVRVNKISLSVLGEGAALSQDMPEIQGEEI